MNIYCYIIRNSVVDLQWWSTNTYPLYKKDSEEEQKNTRLHFYLFIYLCIHGGVIEKKLAMLQYVVKRIKTSKGTHTF